MGTPLRTGFVLGALLGLAATPLAGQDEASPRARWQALRAERLSAFPPAAVATTPAKTVLVDCTKGARISDALAQNAGPLVVKVRGICRENLRIERNDVTLRGRDPATDGVQGVAADPQPSALEFYHANRISLENISISDSPGQGIGAWYSDLTMTNCRVERNGATGMLISAASGLNATGVVVSQNHSSLFGGIHAQRQALVQCVDCRLEGNVPFAAFARFNAVLILGGKVSGGKGIAVSSGAYGEVYCEGASVESECGIDVTDVAVDAEGEGSTAALYGVRPFTGRLNAWSGGRVDIWGAEQILPPGSTNDFAQSAWLSTYAGEGGAATSLGATRLDVFSRAALWAGTVLQDYLSCGNGSDAWSDSPYPAAQVSGCEHVPLSQ